MLEKSAQHYQKNAQRFKNELQEQPL
jgi:hypothetical protein